MTDDPSLRPSRRDLLRLAAGAGLLATAGCGGPGEPGPPIASATAAPGPAPAPAAPLRVLILGGTGFLGPHLVDAARARGHAITLFNRGKTNPGLFPDVETLRGDRDGQLDALRGRTWDVVVDTSGYVPRVVEQSARLLAGAVRQYVFVSTVSVYADLSRPGADEDAPLATMPDPTSEDVPTYYGALKARCEAAVEAALPGRTTNVRPGLIVGPRDPTGRFTYWPVRLRLGGDVLAPGGGDDPVQYVDARDLAAWIVTCAERGTAGVFNALGPARRQSIAEMLAGVRAAVPATDARLVWVPTAVLEREGVQPWSDLPVWIPAEGEHAGVGTTSNARAVAAGLAFRPVTDTARDTLAWLDGLDEATRAKVTRGGLAPDRERAILARLAAAGGGGRAG